MDLLTQAKKDLQMFTQDDFAVALNFENPAKTLNVDVKGLGTSHHLSIDPNTGLPINVKNTHVSISEQVLLDASYPTRNASNEIALINHFVKFYNSAGLLKTYRIRETWPDETLGLIVCILVDYE